MPSVPTPLPFSDSFAHPGDPLPAHLERVAERAAASIATTARPAIHAIAFVAGLFHDLGKATPWFQDYLLRAGRRSSLTHHAELSAILVWWYSAELDWPLWQRLAAFIAVRRHHGALTLQDWPELLIKMMYAVKNESDYPLHQQLQVLDQDGIHNWLITVAARYPNVKLTGVPSPLTAANIKARLLDRQAAGSKLRVAYQNLDEALATLASFGALLAVDKIDAALQGERILRQALPATAVMVHKQKLWGNSSQNSLLDRRREQIAATVTQTWLSHLDNMLLTLTAPTGAGKTLTALHAALQVRDCLAKRHGTAPRIIYCLPFTSIIDQNHAVFRAVLRNNGLSDREDLLLKHHHLVDALFRTQDTEYQPDGAGQLLTETWQSELVITTFYQLLHSLLSPRNTNLKRAGQLTGALVLLDEVQALPLRYWETLRQLLLASARTLGTRWVLLTATRPLIFQPGDAVELLPCHDIHFRAMNRTRLYLHHRKKLPLDEFAQQLISSLQKSAQPTLIILNRRSSVRILFEALQNAFPKRPLIALSTHLTPLERRARIRLIQRLLRQGKPVLAITTQLVEAGVDFSFPIIHRDLAPLDSIIQAAGRCNRHGENHVVPGEVHLWQLQANQLDGTEAQPLWQRVYDSALIEVTVETLGTVNTWDECDFLQLSQDYFRRCRVREDQQRIDKQLVQGNFVGVEKDFQLIEEKPTVSIFVVRKPVDQRLWNDYCTLRDRSQLTPVEQERCFQRFKHRFYERVIQVYAQAGSGLERDGVNRIDVGSKTYDRRVGFIGLPGESSACIL